MIAAPSPLGSAVLTPRCGCLIQRAENLGVVTTYWTWHVFPCALHRQAPAPCQVCGYRWATARKTTGTLVCFVHSGDNVRSWGRPLVRQQTWKMLPDEYKRPSARGPAGETEYGSAVLTAHTPADAPAVLTFNPSTGVTEFVPVIIVEGD